jgi:hypothetical protein
MVFLFPFSLSPGPHLTKEKEKEERRFVAYVESP